MGPKGLHRSDSILVDDIPIFTRAAGDPQVAKFRQACAGMIADYFNAADKWGVEVYLNNKGANPNWPVDLGCLEKDNLQMDSIRLKWENPATLATSYGYMAAEEENDLYQSSEKLIHLSCDVVSRNGNEGRARTTHDQLDRDPIHPIEGRKGCLRHCLPAIGRSVGD